MTEFFIVPYPKNRRVFVDGGPNGRTNRVQSVERGSHTFDLGEPVDYMPDAHFTFVGDTSFEHPQVISFVPVSGAVFVSAVAAVPLPPPAPDKPPTAAPKKKKKKKKKGKKAAKKKAAKKNKKTRRVKHR